MVMCRCGCRGRADVQSVLGLDDEHQYQACAEAFVIAAEFAFGRGVEYGVRWLRTFSLVDHQYGCDMGPMRLSDLERLAQPRKLGVVGEYDTAAAQEADKVQAASANWQSQDYIGDDELVGMLLERPPFGTERHRFLSTILKLRGTR